MALLISFLSIFQFKIYARQTIESEQVSLLKIHGSNTIGEKFAPDLIRSFLQQKGYLVSDTSSFNPKIERLISAENSLANQRLNIELFAHGSSTGFKDLLSRSTEIAMSSRRIKEKEKIALSKLYPSMNQANTEHVIAFDALAIIVNPDNPIKQLNIEQLAMIFSGMISNWSELGGNDQPIIVNARDDNSGTYDTFKSLVLKPSKFSLLATALRFESSVKLASEVTSQLGAIGFVGISHTGESKIVAISKRNTKLGVIPEQHTIGTEDYPLSRKLYLYLPKEILNPIAHEFVKFVKSTEGQFLAKKSQLISFYPTKSKPSFRNVRLKGEFSNLRTFGERLSIAFRLTQDELDSKNLRDIERLKNFHIENPKKRIVLASFTPKATNIAKLEANWMVQIKKKMEEVNIEPWEVYVDASAFIGAPSEISQKLDRRIEVWVL